MNFYQTSDNTTLFSSLIVYAARRTARARKKNRTIAAKITAHVPLQNRTLAAAEPHLQKLRKSHDLPAV